MIEVTLLSGKKLMLNPHQIETVESNPDTTVTLLSGKRIIVLEGVTALVDAIVEYRRRLGAFGNED
jgi:flagellar protein FlbD